MEQEAYKYKVTQLKLDMMVLDNNIVNFRLKAECI